MLHNLNLARGSRDRDELTRNYPSALAKARNSPDARFILVAGSDVAIDPNSPGHVPQTTAATNCQFSSSP